MKSADNPQLPYGFSNPVLISAYSCPGPIPLGQDFKVSPWDFPLAPEAPAAFDHAYEAQFLGKTYLHRT